METIGFIGSGILAFIILACIAMVYLLGRMLFSFAWLLVSERVYKWQRTRELERLLKEGDA